MGRVAVFFVVLLDVAEDDFVDLDSVVECIAGDMWVLIVVNNWLCPPERERYMHTAPQCLNVSDLLPISSRFVHTCWSC